MFRFGKKEEPAPPPLPEPRKAEKSGSNTLPASRTRSAKSQSSSASQPAAMPRSEAEKMDSIATALHQIKDLLIEMQKGSLDDENPAAQMHRVFDQTIEKMVSIENLVTDHHATMIDLIKSNNEMRSEVAAIYEQNLVILKAFKRASTR